MIVDCLRSPKHLRCIAKCCGTCKYCVRFVGKLLTIETGGLSIINTNFCVGDLKGTKTYRDSITEVTTTGVINKKRSLSILDLLDYYGISARDADDLIIDDSVFHKHHVDVVNICENYHPALKYYEYYEKLRVSINTPVKEIQEFEL